MTRRVARVVLALLVALSTGCSSLSVQVDILDPVGVRVVAEESLLLQDYSEIRNATDADIDREVDRLLGRHRSLYVRLANGYRAEAQREGVSEDHRRTYERSAGRLDRAFEGPGGFGQPYERYKGALKEQARRVRQVASRHPLTADHGLPAPLRDALWARRVALAPLLDVLIENIDAAQAQLDAMPDRDEAAASLVVTMSTELKQVARSIVGDGSLVASQYAHPVASAAEGGWTSMFDHAWGNATLGNSDIILRMNRRGEFTVKGMHFDPSTMASLANKVTTQALLLATEMSGVPIDASAAASGERSGLAAVSSGATSIGDALSTRKAKKDAWQIALRHLDLAILAEEQEISATAEQRDAADKAIADQFSAYREMINLGDLQ